ncbi:Ig-like domain-containing protein [uncultured Methanobrevibacter sp.]|uniref:Ig-like domain-containing protein n=1 Tax=uncultured Methanobrevibacter sp. TaxID=253161 RepID=UPI0025D6C763|nr:Ig-like domain-containing protein [uncultured Methanobrevibacter sp.]
MENIYKDEPVKINITINERAPINEGNVSIYINGKLYSENVTNGKATITIPDLNMGTYKGRVTYDGGMM